MIGAKIKAYLEENGIKQAFIAKKVGVDDPTMSAMLSGKRSINAKEYYLICKVLNVPMEKFFSEVE